MKLIKVASKNTLSVPENFDIIEEFKRDGISVWAGGNDWEAGITAVCARTKSSWRGDQEQVWFTLKAPKGLTNDNNQSKEKTDKYYEYGHEVSKKWSKVAKRKDLLDFSTFMMR